jgi:hypothetical protein
MSKVADLMNKLKKQKFSPPPKSEGWFSITEAIDEGGMAERTSKDVLKEGVSSGALETKEFMVWDEQFNRAVRRTYYRENPKAKK